MFFETHSFRGADKRFSRELPPDYKEAGNSAGQQPF
uniref:Uncharacterized protein n=1 Tax=Anguilla anguilla TaxID=7936 RepID=A0A0E9WGE0_ANGAN